MLLLRNMFSSIILRKILIIFGVGFLCRFAVNNFIDISTAPASCLGITALFSVFLQNITNFGNSGFSLSWLSEAINSFLPGNKSHMISGSYFDSNFSHGNRFPEAKKHLHFTSRGKHFPNIPGVGAALQGLYEGNTKGLSSNSKAENLANAPNSSRKKGIPYIPGAGAGLYGLYERNNFGVQNNVH